MAARPSWPRINLRWVNLSLILLVALVAAVWWDDLRWAGKSLPRYLRGSIGAPLERTLYRRAKKLIESGRELDRARELLERSIAIDPHSDAVYWLAEYHRATGSAEAALAAYERFLGFDPTRAGAYLGAAETLETLGRSAEARAVLERGLAYFRANHERLRPRLDPDVRMKYNRKAVKVFEYHGRAIERLEQALGRLGGREPAP